MKKILILGAGLVAKPMVDYLLGQNNFAVTVASRTVSKAEKLVQGHSNGRALPLLVDHDRELEELVRSHDIVVSLLPYVYHVKVARLCLRHRRPLVTTSYVSQEMKSLDAAAREAGILILNEIGLDPGIDHMSAMRIIHDVQERGGKITSFRSYCGGLPAPEANDNPWGYKFSWSPRGVLQAGRNSARFLLRGTIQEIEGGDLFAHHWPIQIEHLQLETYPNRDSLPYIELYGLDGIETMYRGTLRYPGWSKAMLAVSRLGLLKENKISGVKGLPVASVFRQILGISEGENPRNYLQTQHARLVDEEVLGKFDWLGLFSEEPFEAEETTPIDFLATLMLKKMQYKPGERDMIVLYHDFVAEFPDHTEHINSTLLDFGIPHGDSAMSRTVSLPAAIAVKLIAENKISLTGVHIPVDPFIYNPVLDELETLGIVCKEIKKLNEDSITIAP